MIVECDLAYGLRTPVWSQHVVNESLPAWMDWNLGILASLECWSIARSRVQSKVFVSRKMSIGIEWLGTATNFIVFPA